MWVYITFSTAEDKEKLEEGLKSEACMQRNHPRFMSPRLEKDFQPQSQRAFIQRGIFPLNAFHGS